ncbi:MAG: DUF4926 domain-containing protein [Candidatus Sumerlaeia bacterium]|nr:DUF4926 domain-containing protein [Candidatus Sumerlaeia bacterium]
MAREIQVLDVVALSLDKPEINLYRGQVGTVVEILDSETVEVEFSDQHGTVYSLVPLNLSDLLLLQYEPIRAIG